jgi:protein-S-isoprenylcysteine O-methyltransferase Ste14
MQASAGGRGLASRAFFVLSAVVPALYFAFAAATFLHSFLKDHRPSTLLWVVSEGVVMVLLMIRRPPEVVSTRAWDWIVAFAGTFLMLAVRPAEAASSLEWVGFPIQLVGMSLQILAKLSLGRSFGIIAARRGLVSHGAYRVVRHPIYASYLVAHVGFLVCNPTFWNLGVYVAAYAFQVARVLGEEAVLKEDAEYRAYAEQVRWRLVPGIW